MFPRKATLENVKLNQMFGKAIILAAEAHDGQFDKGGHPYILHPFEVTRLLAKYNTEIQTIGILHDVLEDNPKFTVETLREAGMSERVIAGVVALTKVKGESPEEYKAKVLANPDASIVKMADLKHNSDLSRIKGVTERDRARVLKYLNFFYDITISRDWSEYERTNLA